MRSRIGFVVYSLLFVSVFYSGCGESDNPASPPESTTGTVVVNCIPDGIAAPWSLLRPDGWLAVGSSDSTFTQVPAGQSTVTWGSVAGWISPTDSTATLAADDTVIFRGTYSEEQSTLEGFVLIPPTSISMPATFTMGGTAADNETPHQVTLTGRFYMASTEATNGQYVEALQWAYSQGLVTATSSSVRDALDGSSQELLDLDSPGCQISFSGGTFSTSFPDRPVVEVTWYGAVAYCDWLSLQVGLPRAYDHSDWSCNSGDPYTASGYRLPTEAEWEFACRAGTATHFNTGDCLNAGTEANYDGDDPYSGCPTGPDLNRAADVGSYPVNQWNLHDMHGNVWEWCNDWNGSYGGDATNPPGSGSGLLRVLRGGGWGSFAAFCRSAHRGANYPYYSSYRDGFRPVRSTT